MSDYLVTSTELTATANAIRAKTGDNSSIEWESGTGFADAIGDIATGGATLDSISVYTPPGRTLYVVGDAFDSTGMVVVANYTVGGDPVNNVIVSDNDFTISPATMAANTTAVTISYTVNGVTKTTTQAVSVFDVGASLNATSWAAISAFAQAGLGDMLWDIGDCKAITLNGNIGASDVGVAASNLTLYVFILDFNHPENGVADNNIIFGGFKSALTNGKELCLFPSTAAARYDGTLCFNMNHWGYSNCGGWKGCDLRYDILGAVEAAPSGYGAKKTTSTVGYDATTAAITTPKANTLMAALPSDFRNVLRIRTHYVDNKGNSSNTDANVTSVVDAISLLAEFEVFGWRTYANQYEKNHQKLMGYYANGNSKIKYHHSSQQASSVNWLTASPYNTSSETFCIVNYSGTSSGGNASVPNGLAPVFKV